MENKIKLDAERWVEERMALLAAPDGWEPDAGVARTRLQGRLSARRPTLARIWLPRVAVAAVACLVLLFAIPTTRALTQQFWRWLTVQRFEVVQADFQKLNGIWLVPQIVEKELQPGEEPPPVPPAVDFMEAARRAGFTPRLPHEGAPPVAPVLTVFNDSMVWSTTLNVANMEASLHQAGVNDQPIPKEWEGAQVSFTTRSAILAAWRGGEMSLMQHPLITFSAPAGFDFAVYWTGALRAAGVNREQARALAERMRTTPTILLGITSKNKKTIREVYLNTGPATLIETIGTPWSGEDDRALLIWSVADRVYHLEAKNAEQVIAAANSIPLEDDAAVLVPGIVAGDRFPSGSYEILVEDVKSILTFTADGRIIGKKVGGGPDIEGIYTTNGDEIVLKDMKEKRGNTEEGCAGEGKYKWSFDGKALSFTKIADDCEGRVMALTANPLPLVKEKK